MRLNGIFLGRSAGLLCVCGSMALAEGDGTKVRPLDQLLIADSMSAAEMSSLASQLECEEYLVVGGHQGGVVLEEGGPLMRTGTDFGEFVLVGERVRRGVLWNSGVESVWVRVGIDAEATEIRGGTMLVVGDILTDVGVIASRAGGLPISRTATVVCGEGYYACCTGTGGTSYKARCRCNGTDDSMCIAGGEGSTSCTVGD